MKIEELFEDENETLNLSVRITHGNWNQPRFFVEASLRPNRDDSPDWLKQAKGNNPVVVVEATVDLIHTQHEVHVTHILSHRKGKGYAAELLKWIAKQAKSKGFNSISAYIENQNVNSRSMVEKAGWSQQKQEKHGAYWGKKLN